RCPRDLSLYPAGAPGSAPRSRSHLCTPLTLGPAPAPWLTWIPSAFHPTIPVGDRSTDGQRAVVAAQGLLRAGGECHEGWVGRSGRGVAVVFASAGRRAGRGAGPAAGRWAGDAAREAAPPRNTPRDLHVAPVQRVRHRQRLGERPARVAGPEPGSLG